METDTVFCPVNMGYSMDAAGNDGESVFPKNRWGISLSYCNLKVEDIENND